MAKLPKREQAWTVGDREALHALPEAVKLVKANATAKFDETVEISVNLGVDPRHADQNVRGVVSLPSGTGRDVRVAVIAKDAKAAAIEFRVEKTGIVHAGVGKVSFTDEALLINVRALVDALVKAKPSGAKGIYVKRISMSSTMGPGFKVDTT